VLLIENSDESRQLEAGAVLTASRVGVGIQAHWCRHAHDSDRHLDRSLQTANDKSNDKLWGPDGWHTIYGRLCNFSTLCSSAGMSFHL